MYVDGKGEVCSHSPTFTFCAPKPLEDLVTLEEGAQGEEGGTDMLMVVPRAELLQVGMGEGTCRWAGGLEIGSITESTSIVLIQ